MLSLKFYSNAAFVFYCLVSDLLFQLLSLSCLGQFCSRDRGMPLVDAKMLAMIFFLS